MKIWFTLQRKTKGVQYLDTTNMYRDKEDNFVFSRIAHFVPLPEEYNHILDLKNQPFPRLKKTADFPTVVSFAIL